MTGNVKSSISERNAVKVSRGFSAAIVLSAILVGLAFPALPQLVPIARASTSICKYDKQNVYTRNGDVVADVWIRVEIQTCGTIDQAGARFTATSQNVTMYCWNAKKNSIIDGRCGEDFDVNSGQVTFVGLVNGQVGYQSTVLDTASFLNWYFAPTPIIGAQSFSSTIDYAQSYWTLNFTDNLATTVIGSKPEPECRGLPGTTAAVCVISGVQFIGTYNAFEQDWADGTNDGTVDIADLASLGSVWNSGDTYWDFNRNGVVDSSDRSILINHYSQVWHASPFPGQGEAAKVLDGNPTWSALFLRHGGWVTSLQVPQVPQGTTLCDFMPQPDKAYCNALPHFS